MSEVIHLEDEMEEIVDKVNGNIAEFGEIQYMFGHPLEIVNRLQLKTNSTTVKNEKYPLIILFTDIPIDRRTNFYGTAKLQMIVATLTKNDYTAPQRLENSFKPILQPIKVELIKQISLHKQFTFENELEYTEIERYYWGKQGLYGNTGNVFNDYIDAIELQNIEVTIKNRICSSQNIPS